VNAWFPFDISNCAELAVVCHKERVRADPRNEYYLTRRTLPNGKDTAAKMPSRPSTYSVICHTVSNFIQRLNYKGHKGNLSMQLAVGREAMRVEAGLSEMGCLLHR
jgi:hypothetical protein